MIDNPEHVPSINSSFLDDEWSVDCTCGMKVLGLQSQDEAQDVLIQHLSSLEPTLFDHPAREIEDTAL